jgi:hypothetical protein
MIGSTWVVAVQQVKNGSANWPFLHCEGVCTMSSPDSTEASYVDPATSFVVNIMTGVFLCGFGIIFFFCVWPLGVVLILAGLIAPFYMMTLKTLQGPCPYCGHTIRVQDGKPGVTCAACKKRSVVRSKRFLRVE